MLAIPRTLAPVCNGIRDINVSEYLDHWVAVPEMAYWIFKIANQSLYDDAPGERYVYDNTHSVNGASVESVRRPAHFCRLIMERHNYTCIICGSTLKPVLEAARLSPYAVGKENRANHANGICLCAFCHRLLDRRLIAIRPNGQLLISEAISDEVALDHLTKVSDSERRVWLSGVDPKFLNLSVKWLEEYAVLTRASSKRPKLAPEYLGLKFCKLLLNPNSEFLSQFRIVRVSGNQTHDSRSVKE